MKKLFFLACFIAYASTGVSLASSQEEGSADQLIRIMMKTKGNIPAYDLTRDRNPNDYQNVYNLAIKYPQLLKGIIHDGRTFAMLCVERGYADVLERLINEDHPVDLATPCNLLGPNEPQTTVLHRLISEVSKTRFCKFYSEDYATRITALTKLIINRYPDLLDMRVKGTRSAGFWALELHLNDLIPPHLSK